MATFTNAQLQQLAFDAGVSAQLAPTMAAIALAESGGCQYALACTVDLRPVKECTFRDTTGQRSPECSYGLWQINMITADPPHLDLFDPQANARAMAARLLDQGLGAWTTYTSGAYRQHLQPASVRARTHYVPPVSRRASPHAPGAWHDFTRALGHGLAASLYTTRRVRGHLYRRVR